MLPRRAHVYGRPMKLALVLLPVAVAAALLLAAPAPAAAQSGPAPPGPPPPAATPSVAPVRARTFTRFVAVDYLATPNVYNELSPGNSGNGSFAAHGALEFPLGRTVAMIAGDFEQFQYPHNALHGAVPCTPGDPACAVATAVGMGTYRTGTCPAADSGCVTVVGYPLVAAVSGLTQAYVPAFRAQEQSAQATLGVKLFDPHVFATAAFFGKSFQQLGYPRVSAIGFGVAKLPEDDVRLSFYGDATYYPNVSGTYTFPTSTYLGAVSGRSVTLAYRYWKYHVGGTLGLRSGRAFLDVGVAGERGNARTNAPSNTNLYSPYAGVGFRF